MDQDALTGLGLTSGECRVYLSLVKLGSSTTGPLAMQSGVSSSKVYKILDRLERKGLVGHIIRSKTKHFTALPASRILDYLDQKRQEMEKKRARFAEVLPLLESERRKATKQVDAAVYEGAKAVTNLFRTMLDELKPGERYYVIGAGYGDVPHLREFFYSHHRRRAAKGVHVKMLANFDVKDTLVKTTRKDSHIRFLPAYMVTPMEIVFYQDKAFITIWTTEPKAFFIQNEEAVRSFQAYFDTFWKIGKP